MAMLNWERCCKTMGVTNNKKVCMVGHFANGVKKFDGQTIKTRIIFEQLKYAYGRNDVTFVDTYGWKKSPIKLLNKCKTAARENDQILIMPASRGARIFVPLFVWLKKKYDFTLHYILIGGRIYAVAEKNAFLKEKMKKVDFIYAENHGVIRKLNKLGVKNVSYMPNFKDLKKTSTRKEIFDGYAHYCIFSRIEREKGVVDAIEIVGKYNSSHNDKIQLDIYGKIRDDFNDEFRRLISNNKYIEYKGVINPEDSVNVVEKYDFLLFPTRYKTEGVPGTIIDAFFAGTPVLASRWENFDEIISEGKNGFGYKFNDNEDFYNKLESITQNKKQLARLRKNCLSTADRYTPKKAMRILLTNIDRELLK